tara:strand:- start:122 stop:451 length:330 start_codon:yes stop_codon:yes gene_type:complete
MKIHIWITKKDAMEGKLDPTNYYCQKPIYKVKGSPEYIQVSITPDEFTRLEDSNDFMHNQLEKSQLKDEFPEYSDIKLGDFAEWWNNMPLERKELFAELNNKLQGSKRK